MSAPLRRLLPMPLLTVVLAAGWLWLNDTVSAGHVLLGLALGLAIPWFTARFAGPTPRVALHRLPAFLALVLWDVVLANLQVAAQILGPVSRLAPGFVRIPLDVTTDRAISVLASVITLTPGTVSVAISADRRELLVHYLSNRAPDGLVHEIKERYERRIRGIFEC